MIANFFSGSEVPRLDAGSSQRPVGPAKSPEGPSFNDYLERIRQADEQKSNDAWDPFGQNHTRAADKEDSGKSGQPGNVPETPTEKKQKNTGTNSESPQSRDKPGPVKQGGSDSTGARLESAPVLQGSQANGHESPTGGATGKLQISGEDQHAAGTPGTPDSPETIAGKKKVRQGASPAEAGGELSGTAAPGPEVLAAKNRETTSELADARANVAAGFAAGELKAGPNAAAPLTETGGARPAGTVALVSGTDVPTLIQVVDLRTSEGRLRALRADARAEGGEGLRGSSASSLFSTRGAQQFLADHGIQLEARQLDAADQQVPGNSRLSRMDQLTLELAPRVRSDAVQNSGALAALVQQLVREQGDQREPGGSTRRQAEIGQAHLADAGRFTQNQARNVATRYVADVETFKQALVEYLRTSGADELVRSTKFVLRDNNRGQIKLILRPGELGQIKINLSLDNNRIEGTVVVDNKEVEAAFAETLEDILAAFREGGYEMGEFKVVTSGGRDDVEPNAVSALLGDAPESFQSRNTGAAAEHGYEISSGRHGEMHVNLSV